MPQIRENDVWSPVTVNVYDQSGDVYNESPIYYYNNVDDVWEIEQPAFDNIDIVGTGTNSDYSDHIPNSSDRDSGPLGTFPDTYQRQYEAQKVFSGSPNETISDQSSVTWDLINFTENDMDTENLVYIDSIDSSSMTMLCTNNPEPDTWASQYSDFNIDPASQNSSVTVQAEYQNVVGTLPVDVVCMTTDTPVLMADGSTKPLGDVETGDKIYAYNTETEEKEIREVSYKLKKRKAPDVRTYTIETGRELKMTDDHEVFVKRDGEMFWTEARELVEGDKFLSDKKSWDKIVDISDQYEAEVSNISVDTTHVYFANSYLVHNNVD